MRLRSPPLFWRTFLLILLLFAACTAVWWPAVRTFEREPRARQIAQQVVSIVNTTRSALVYSDPERRRYLLTDLAENAVQYAHAHDSGLLSRNHALIGIPRQETFPGIEKRELGLAETPGRDRGGPDPHSAIL